MLDALKDGLPKALIGALIPLAQFLWKQLQQRNVSARKDCLRKRVIDLSRQLADFNALAGTTPLESAKKDLEAELATASAALAGLTAPHKAFERPRDRSLVARAFLLYAPRGVWAWIVHTLFFMNLYVVITGAIVVLTTLDDPEVGYTALGIFLFALPAIGLNAIARALDKRVNRSTAGADDEPAGPGEGRPPVASTLAASGSGVAERGAVARALLLFVPHGAAGWVFHGLFYFNTLFVLLGIVGMIADASGDELTEGFVGAFVLSLPTLLWRTLALRSDRHPSFNTRSISSSSASKEA